MKEIILPWPHSSLSPNSRVHWAEKSRHNKSTKNYAWAATLEAKIKLVEGPIDLHITFRPADKRRRDIDNMIASCKGLLDGVALGLGVDDSRFRLHLEVGEPMRGGAVVIKLSQQERIAA